MSHGTCICTHINSVANSVTLQLSLQRDCYNMIFKITHELYLAPTPPPSLAVKIYEINRQSYLNCGIKKCKHSSRKIVAQKATRRNNSLSKSGFRTDIKPLGCHCPPGSSTRRTSPVTRHWKIRDTRPLFNKSRSLHIY